MDFCHDPQCSWATWSAAADGVVSGYQRKEISVGDWLSVQGVQGVQGGPLHPARAANAAIPAAPIATPSFDIGTSLALLSGRSPFR